MTSLGYAMLMVLICEVDDPADRADLPYSPEEADFNSPVMSQAVLSIVRSIGPGCCDWWCCGAGWWKLGRGELTTREPGDPRPVSPEGSNHPYHSRTLLPGRAPPVRGRGIRSSAKPAAGFGFPPVL